MSLLPWQDHLQYRINLVQYKVPKTVWSFSTGYCVTLGIEILWKMYRCTIFGRTAHFTTPLDRILLIA